MSSIEIRERSKDRQEEKQGAKYCSPLREKTQPDSNDDVTEEEWLQPEGHSPVPVPQLSRVPVLMYGKQSGRPLRWHSVFYRLSPLLAFGTTE